MKKQFYTLLLLASVLSGCETDEGINYDAPHKSVNITIDYQTPGTIIEGRFKGNTFRCGSKLGSDYQDRTPKFPAALFGENGLGSVSGNLELYTVDNNNRPTGEIASFPITLKADTTLTFRRAVTDRIRQ